MFVVGEMLEESRGGGALSVPLHGHLEDGVAEGEVRVISNRVANPDVAAFVLVGVPLQALNLMQLLTVIARHMVWQVRLEELQKLGCVEGVVAPSAFQVGDGEKGI